MNFKIWLENIESAEDIFNKYSRIILSSPNYQSAIQNLEKEGIKPNFDTSRHGGLGHKWAEVFYQNIAAEGGEENPELDSQLANLNSQIISMGFKSLDSTDPFYFFGIPNYKPDGAKQKIHVKIPTDKLNLLLELVKLIKEKINYVRQFKFSAFGKGFQTRRDNFIIYLSKTGEQNVNELRQQISSLGLSTDVGVDYKGESGWGLSQTQLVSLRLAAILVTRSGSPPPKFQNSSHWQTTEKEFLLSDPIGSKYISNEKTTQSDSQDYQPKTLILSGGSRPININIDTQIGKYGLQQSLGNNAQYFSNPQFQIKKSNNGWFLIPNNNAVNKTIINGSLVSNNTKLQINDKIGVIGKSGNKIMPLVVTGV